jgi:hypothetical protein
MGLGPDNLFEQVLNWRPTISVKRYPCVLCLGFICRFQPSVICALHLECT